MIDGVGLGLLAPEPHCEKQLVFDLDYSLYGSTRPRIEAPLSTRFGLDVGVLWKIPTRKNAFDAGAVLGVSFGGFDPELKGQLLDWQFAPKAKLRWWLDWMTIEGSAGPTLTLSQTGAGQVTRPGAYLEVGPRLFGFLGLFGSAEIIAGAGELRTEERFGFGATITIGAGAIGAALAAYIAACSHSICR